MATPAGSSDAQHLKLLTNTAIHEIMHLLAVSTNSFALFRKPDGSPYNDRDSNGEPTKTNNYQCPTRVIETVAVPAIFTVVEERGGPVHKMNTPTVLQAVRDHFNCPTLNGLGSCDAKHYPVLLFILLSSNRDGELSHSAGFLFC